jgi:hypothetical protein
MNSMIFLLISNELWHEIDAAAQPLPTGDLGGADFTENANACPSVRSTGVWGLCSSKDYIRIYAKWGYRLVVGACSKANTRVQKDDELFTT